MSNYTIIASGGAGNPTAAEIDTLINPFPISFPHGDLGTPSSDRPFGFPSNPAFETPSLELPSLKDILDALNAESIKKSEKYKPLFEQAAEKGLKVAIIQKPSLLAINNAPPVVQMVCFDKDGNKVPAPADMQATFNKIQQQETPIKSVFEIPESAEKPVYLHQYEFYKSPNALRNVTGTPTMDFHTAVTGGGFTAVPDAYYKPAADWVDQNSNIDNITTPKSTYEPAF